MNILADSFQKLQNNKYKIELDFFESILISEISLYIYIYINEMEDFIGYSSNEFQIIKIF